MLAPVASTRVTGSTGSTITTDDCRAVVNAEDITSPMRLRKASRPKLEKLEPPPNALASIVPLGVHKTAAVLVPPQSIARYRSIEEGMSSVLSICETESGILNLKDHDNNGRESCRF